MWIILGFQNLAQDFKLIQSWCKIKDKSTLRELAGIIVVDTQLLSHAAQKDIFETENLFKFWIYADIMMVWVLV